MSDLGKDAEPSVQWLLHWEFLGDDVSHQHRRRRGEQADRPDLNGVPQLDRAALAESRVFHRTTSDGLRTQVSNSGVDFLSFTSHCFYEAVCSEANTTPLLRASLPLYVQ